ncbi:unnamed protein product [Peniophora sp. CBMAI 1063]|nr:unnamed protein product [Peniophora sp. CBMAI 1063]
MFPITFNAIGDILALAQIVYDIVQALNDSVHGAAAECQRFAHELKLLGAVIVIAHRAANTSPDDVLKEALLTEVRLCYAEIVEAGKLLPGFDTLLRTSTGATVWDRARAVAKKLKWHFMKASDAATFTDRFHAVHLRLNVLVGSLNQGVVTDGFAHLSLKFEETSDVSRRHHLLTHREIAQSTSRLSEELRASYTSLLDAIRESQTSARSGETMCPTDIDRAASSALRPGSDSQNRGRTILQVPENERMDYALHWQLLPKHQAKFTSKKPRMHFDIRFPAEYASHVPDGKGHTPISRIYFEKPATMKNLSCMTFTNCNLPMFDIEVHRHEGVRVCDVLERVYEHYQLVLTRAEKRAHPERVERAQWYYEDRVRTELRLDPAYVDPGMRRIDLMEGNVVFMGCQWRHPCGEYSKGAWTLMFLPPPRPATSDAPAYAAAHLGMAIMSNLATFLIPRRRST